MIVCRERKFVVLADLAFWIQKAFQTISARIDELRCCKQLYRIAERKRIVANLSGGWIVHSEMLQSAEHIGDEPSVTRVEHVQLQLVNVRMLRQVLEQPDCHVVCVD